MFLLITVKLPVPNLSILLVIREKATVFDGPWFATEVNSKKKNRNDVMVSTRKRDFHNISCIFPILGAIAIVKKLYNSFFRKML